MCVYCKFRLIRQKYQHEYVLIKYIYFVFINLKIKYIITTLRVYKYTRMCMLPVITRVLHLFNNCEQTNICDASDLKKIVLVSAIYPV